jgi:hypothetical protein
VPYCITRATTRFVRCCSYRLSITTQKKALNLRLVSRQWGRQSSLTACPIVFHHLRVFFTQCVMKESVCLSTYLNSENAGWVFTYLAYAVASSMYYRIFVSPLYCNMYNIANIMALTVGNSVMWEMRLSWIHWLVNMMSTVQQTPYVIYEFVP